MQYYVLKFRFRFAAVVATFDSVSNEFWETCASAGVSGRVMYAVGVIHGVLKARQMYGSVGLSQYYPLSSSVYCHALETLMTSSSAGDGAAQLSDDMICDLLINVRHTAECKQNILFVNGNKSPTE